MVSSITHLSLLFVVAVVASVVFTTEGASVRVKRCAVSPCPDVIDPDHRCQGRLCRRSTRGGDDDDDDDDGGTFDTVGSGILGRKKRAAPPPEDEEEDDFYRKKR
ncbi:immediate-early protein [White spot syndrome virus]|nr:wsv178 [White spot syndrome virus]ASV62912.1 immediate-early protein [White spot syndrome virus]UVD54614.1 hypothetical protein BCACJCBH_00051 [White spot syndrome virus]